MPECQKCHHEWASKVPNPLKCPLCGNTAWQYPPGVGVMGARRRVLEMPKKVEVRMPTAEEQAAMLMEAPVPEDEMGWGRPAAGGQEILDEAELQALVAGPVKTECGFRTKDSERGVWGICRLEKGHKGQHGNWREEEFT